MGMATQLDALRTFYAAAGGVHWPSNAGWLGSTSPCDGWFGLTCDTAGEAVSALEVSPGGAHCAPEVSPSECFPSWKGTVPTELGQLSGLAYLYLDSMPLTGTAPTELGGLSKLQQLSLSHMPVSGTTPTQMGRLTELIYGEMFTNCSSSGTLPTQLAQLSALETLSSLFHDSLSGTLQTQLGRLGALVRMAFDDTKGLSGTIPTELGSLGALTGVHLGPTSVSGVVPTQLGQLAMPAMRIEAPSIKLSTTFVSGTAPTQLAKLTNLTYLNIDASALSGTLQTELGELRLLQFLSMGGGTSLSGTVPSQLGGLSMMSLLAVGNAPAVSGTVPRELAAQSTLSLLDLSGTSLSGTMPSELGTLFKLQQLLLGTTSMTGAVPEQLSRLDGLTQLDLFDMDLSGQLPASVMHMCKPFGARCDCTGLPPLGCSAFGPHARLSLTSAGACVRCPARELTVVKLSLAGLLLPLGVLLYVWAVARFPHFKSWIATTSLVLSHLQVVGLLSSLTAFGGASDGVLAALRMAVVVSANLGAVHPQCLLKQQPRPRASQQVVIHNSDGSTTVAQSLVTYDIRAFLRSPSFLGGIAALAIPLLALLAIAMAKRRAYKKPLRTARAGSAPGTARADPADPEPPQTTEGGLPSPPSVPSDTSSVTPTATSPPAPPAPSAPPTPPMPPTPPAPPTLPAPPTPPTLPTPRATAAGLRRVDMLENCAIIIFSLQLPTVCTLGLHSVVLGSLSHGDRGALIVGVPILTCEAVYVLRLLQHMRALLGRRSCLGRWHTPLPEARLRARLRYLTGKYADHAPHWQFVLWARQLTLIAVNEAFAGFDGSPMVLAQAAATLLVLAAALVLHTRTAPYQHRYQNVGESVLASCSILGVVGGCVYYVYHEQLGVASVAVIEAAFVGMLLGPAVGFVAWVVLSAPRLKTAWRSKMSELLLPGGDEMSINARDVVGVQREAGSGQHTAMTSGSQAN